jgi:hypothetical protein
MQFFSGNRMYRNCKAQRLSPPLVLNLHATWTQNHSFKFWSLCLFVSGDIYLSLSLTSIDSADIVEHDFDQTSKIWEQYDVTDHSCKHKQKTSSSSHHECIHETGPQWGPLCAALCPDSCIISCVSKLPEHNADDLSPSDQSTDITK